MFDAMAMKGEMLGNYNTPRHLVLCHRGQFVLKSLMISAGHVTINSAGTLLATCS
jgi:hypothetical protein